MGSSSWQPACPGGAAAVAATPAVYRARYDYETPVLRPANNASNAVLKEAELQTYNKAAVYKAYLLLRAKLINSFAPEDIIAPVHSLRTILVQSSHN